jgi:hypothetical protein
MNQGFLLNIDHISANINDNHQNGYFNLNIHDIRG